MKCMIIRKADPDTEAGKLPSDALLKAMGDYNTRLVDAGVWVDGTGLKPSNTGVRITFSGGRPSVTDGPFTEVKELIAGFTMIETDTFEEALAWARQWPPEDGEVELELRPVFGIEDFDPGPGLEVHKDYAARLARQPSGMSAYLEFTGQCREAFELYARALGGEVGAMMSWGDVPMETGAGPERSQWVAHATLAAGRHVLAGIDLLHDPGEGHKPGHVLLNFATPEQTRAACEALAEGGRIVMGPAATFWSACFAVLVDRFGTQWSLNCDQPAAAG